MHVAWYFEETHVQNPFGYSALDMKSYFMGRTIGHWRQATLAHMALATHMSSETLPHRAVLDAVIQGIIFEKLLKLNESTP
jgi:hypothetical protein